MCTLYLIKPDAKHRFNLARRSGRTTAAQRAIVTNDRIAVAHGFQDQRRAARVRGHRAPRVPEGLQGARDPLPRRHLARGEHEAARRDRRARHVGAAGIRRLRARHPRHRAGARGNRQGVLRDGDGGAGRARRADARHLHLRAGTDQAAHPAARRDRRSDPRHLHDRAQRRHRRAELHHQHRRQGRPRGRERREDADLARRHRRDVRRLHARQQGARARRASAACWCRAARRA